MKWSEKQSGMKKRKKGLIRLLGTLLIAAMLPVSAAEQKISEQTFYHVGDVVFQTVFEGYIGGVPEGFWSNAAHGLRKGKQGVQIETGASLQKTLEREMQGFVILEAEIQAEAGEKVILQVSDSSGNLSKGILLAEDGDARLYCGKGDWQTELLSGKKKNGKFTLCVDTVRDTVSAGVGGKILLKRKEISQPIEGVKTISFINQSGGELIVKNLKINYGTDLELGEIAGDSQDTIFVQIGNNQGYHRKNKIPLHVLNPEVRVFEEGEVYLPLKFLNECYEIPLVWNADANEAQISAAHQVKIREGSKKVWTDGEEISFEYPALIRDGVMYIPISMAEYVFGKKASYGREGLVALEQVELNLDSMPERINLILAELSGSGLEEKLEKLDLGMAEKVVAENILDQAWLSGDFGSKEKVAVSDMPFDSAWSLRTEKQPPGNYWDYKLAMPTVGDIQAGDICLLTMYARTISAADESGNAQFEVVVEQNFNPWGKSLTVPFAVTNQWQRFFIPFQAKIDHPAGETEVNIRLGYRPQVLEVADLQLLNFKHSYALVDMPTTQTTYVGREEDAAWRRECLDEIQKNRRHELAVRVTDKEGNPLEGAEVHVEMQEHKVDFGTSVSQWYVTGQNMNDTEKGRADIRNYQDTLLKYFNLAVPENAYKWVLWEDGRKSNSRMCTDWLWRNNMRIKGHSLYWDSKDYSPANIRNIAFTDPLRFDQMVRQHITDMAAEFKDQIFVWDCLNEPSQSRNLLDSLGEEQIRGWFEAARAAAPEAELYVNEMQILGEDNVQFRKFTQIVEDMVENDVPFDGVGLQGHFGSVPAGPVAFLNQLKHFSKITGGKKVAVTEYDMLSPDEALQADFLRDVMIACYSIPEFQSFIMWGHWDSDHWRRNSPTFRADWSMKPGGQMWYRLTQYVWNTNVSGSTDESGVFGLDVYEGNYKITVTKDGKEVQTEQKVWDDGKVQLIVY